MTKRQSRRRPALRRRLPVRLIIIIMATLFAFPWLPFVLLATVAGTAFMALSVIAALAYAAILWVTAHAVAIAAVTAVVAAAAGVLQIASLMKWWGQMGLAR